MPTQNDISMYCFLNVVNMRKKLVVSGLLHATGNEWKLIPTKFLQICGLVRFLLIFIHTEQFPINPTMPSPAVDLIVSGKPKSNIDHVVNWIFIPYAMQLCIQFCCALNSEEIYSEFQFISIPACRIYDKSFLFKHIIKISP